MCPYVWQGDGGGRVKSWLFLLLPVTFIIEWPFDELYTCELFSPHAPCYARPEMANVLQCTTC